MSQIGSPPITPPPGSGPNPTGDISPAQTGTTVTSPPQTPLLTEVAPQTSTAESRMQAMRTAIRKSGGILLLDQFHIDAGALTGKKPSSAAVKAQKKVQRQVAQVKKAFDELDALGPAAFKKATLDKKTSKVVENAFKQLDALDQSLAAFEKAAGASTATRSLRDACMARLCELSRFVGALQAEAMTETQRLESGIHGFEALQGEGKSVRDMLSDLAVSMHGNDPATRDVSAEAEKLFDEVQTLKTTCKTLSPADAARAAAALRERAVALGQKVDDILAPPAPGQSKSMPGEPALFRAIGDYAKTAVADMDGLLRQTPRDTISPLLEAAFPGVDASLPGRCGKLPLFLTKIFEHLLPEINGNHSELTGKLGAGSLTGQDVLNASALFSGSDARMARASLHLMKGIIEGQYTSRPEAGKAFIKEFEAASGEKFGKDDRKKLRRIADALMDAMLPLRKASAAEKQPYLQLYEQLMQAPLLLHDRVVERDVLEIADAVDRSKNPIPVARYLPLLFEQKAKLSTLITAAMYNIPPEHLEVRPDSGTAVGSKVLGQGAANTVRLCQYTDDHGIPFNLVFKPESPARAGLEGLRISGMGYQDSIRVANLNVASSTVAGLLGTPRVVATSSLGFFEGTPGLFMSHAPGKTPRDLIHSGQMHGLSKKLQKTGKLEIALGNLQRELCRLEWADLLSGQGDRHGMNYLVDINPEDGSVTVTGIDNDASFGERMVGITTVDLTDMPNVNAILGDRDQDNYVVDTPLEKCQRNGGKHPPYELRDGKLLIHLDQIQDPEMYKEVRDLLGMNQMFLPSHIDQTTYDHLMALTPDAYRESLRPFLSSKALDAAVQRLKSAQEHALELMKTGRCLKNGQWQNRELLVEARTAINSPRHTEFGILGLEFFARDFSALIL